MNSFLKAVFILTVAVLVLLACFSVYSGATGNGASLEEQKKVAQLVNNDPVYGKRLSDNKETILTETIAPLFRFNPVEYGKTGRFSISRIEGYYWADVVTETGAFAGVATVVIENNSLKMVHFDRSTETAGTDHIGSYLMPCSFENYRQDIERYIGEAVSADSVLAVKVVSHGDAYYIDQPDGAFDYFVWHPTGGKTITQDSIVRIDDDFYNLCKTESQEYFAELDKRRAEREEWEINHPGATFPVYYGGVGLELNNDSGKNNAVTATVMISICSLLIVGVLLTFVIILAKRRKMKNNNGV
jgi:hypothetical protein